MESLNENAQKRGFKDYEEFHDFINQMKIFEDEFVEEYRAWFMGKGTKEELIKLVEKYKKGISDE